MSDGLVILRRDPVREYFYTVYEGEEVDTAQIGSGATTPAWLFGYGKLLLPDSGAD